MSSDARLPPRNSGMLRDVHERIAPLVGGVANDRRASNNAHRGNSWLGGHDVHNIGLFSNGRRSDARRHRRRPLGVFPGALTWLQSRGLPRLQ